MLEHLPVSAKVFLLVTDSSILSERQCPEATHMPLERQIQTRSISPCVKKGDIPSPSPYSIYFRKLVDSSAPLRCLSFKKLNGPLASFITQECFFQGPGCHLFIM